MRILIIIVLIAVFVSIALPTFAQLAEPIERTSKVIFDGDKLVDECPIEKNCASWDVNNVTEVIIFNDVKLYTSVYIDRLEARILALESVK